MDKTYQSVLEEHFAHLAPRTQRSVRVFYASLPPPGGLTKEYVRKRLSGLSPHTQTAYMSYFRVLERALGTDLTDGVRVPKRPPTVRRADLYSDEEIRAVLAACTETRDRAMFSVLYESGMRAFELLQLQFEDMTAEQELWWLSVRGKRQIERTVPIMHSIPALQAWLDVHPVGKGPIWVSLDAPFAPLFYSGLHSRLRLVLKRASVRIRHRPIHLFRHTRLTELARLGMSESSLCLFAGWSLGSPETKIYIHLSGRDLKSSFRRMYGLPETAEDRPVLKLESVECPRCHTKNAPGARFCAQCSLTLSADVESIMKKRPEAQAQLVEQLRKDYEELKAELQAIKRARELRERLDDI